MEYRSMVFCEHANETPSKQCICPQYCGCREAYQGVCYSDRSLLPISKEREIQRFELADAEQAVIKAAVNVIYKHYDAIFSKFQYDDDYELRENVNHLHAAIEQYEKIKEASK